LNFKEIDNTRKKHSMDSKKIELFLEHENLRLESDYLEFLGTNYLYEISKTVHFDHHDWPVNRIERPFTMEEMISDEFDSIDSCLKYFDTNRSNPILISNFFQEEEELINCWTDFKKFHPLFEKGFLIIGLLDAPHASILLLGIHEKNFGQIWIEVGNSSTVIKMANNINDFIKEFKFTTYDILTDQFGLNFEKSPEGYYEIKKD
jgi:hypothetical protein